MSLPCSNLFPASLNSSLWQSNVHIRLVPKVHLAHMTQINSKGWNCVRHQPLLLFGGSWTSHNQIHDSLIRHLQAFKITFENGPLDPGDTLTLVHLLNQEIMDLGVDISSDEALDNLNPKYFWRISWVLCTRLQRAQVVRRYVRMNLGARRIIRNRAVDKASHGWWITCPYKN